MDFINIQRLVVKVGGAARHPVLVGEAEAAGLGDHRAGCGAELGAEAEGVGPVAGAPAGLVDAVFIALPLARALDEEVPYAGVLLGEQRDGLPAVEIADQGNRADGA